MLLDRIAHRLSVVKKRVAIIVIILIPVALVFGCKSAKERLEEEARAEAQKFWESRVFSKCENDYFGKREGKIHQFHSAIAIVADAPSPSDVYEWYGKSLLLSSRWRTFEVANCRIGKRKK